MLYITLVTEHSEVTSQERREVVGSQRLDLVSHRFVVVDQEFETLDEGLRVVVLDREEMFLPRSLVSEQEESSVAIHTSWADRSYITTADELSNRTAVHLVDFLLKQLFLFFLNDS